VAVHVDSVVLAVAHLHGQCSSAPAAPQFTRLHQPMSSPQARRPAIGGCPHWPMRQKPAATRSTK